MDGTSENQNRFAIRLQFPNGSSRLVDVFPSTKVSDLYEEHVSQEVTAGMFVKISELEKKTQN